MPGNGYGTSGRVRMWLGYLRQKIKIGQMLFCSFVMHMGVRFSSVCNGTVYPAVVRMAIHL